MLNFELKSQLDSMCNEIEVFEKVFEGFFFDNFFLFDFRISHEIRYGDFFFINTRKKKRLNLIVLNFFFFEAKIHSYHTASKYFQIQSTKRRRRRGRREKNEKFQNEKK